MRSFWGWLIGLIVIAAIVVGVILAMGNNNKTTTTTTSKTTNTSNQNNSNASTNSSATATNKVSIQNLSFMPTAITVKKGTQVTWTNNDSTQHTVTENDGKNGPSAPPLDPGKDYSFTFNEIGTFHYHCSIHHEMAGTVTVTE
jgi:plastocyanin